MRFNPSFIQLKRTIEEANDFNSSIDNANPHRSWLMLCPNEVYNQYILLDEDLAPLLEQSNLLKVELWSAQKGLLNNNIGFGYRKLQNNCLFFSFKILGDYDTDCLYMKLKFNGLLLYGRNEAELYTYLYTNLFTCSELNKDYSSIVTYKHRENHYEIPYREIPVFVNQDGTESKHFSNQIRLPIYYLKKKTEQDSTENTYAANTPTNINVGRVNRRQIKIWQTIASDYINERLAIVSDTDFVYINGQREVTRPYEFEEVSNGSDFSLSNLESQPVFGDNYIDEYGLVNHIPVIISVDFPDGNCCDPNGTMKEPEIISESTQSDTCEFQGVHKKFNVSGHPNTTVKYRLTMASMSGASKLIEIYNGDTYNSHMFNNTSNVFVGFFFLNNFGNAEMNIKCCLEDCVPGAEIGVNATLELYNYDGFTLNGETCNISKSKICGMPETPKWQINSETGTDFKNVSVTGAANSIANFEVKILSQISSTHYWPPNNITLEGFLNKDGVVTGETWEFSIPIGSSGVSNDFDISVDAGSYLGLMPPEANIFVSLTLRDVNGDLSTETIGISDIHKRP